MSPELTVSDWLDLTVGRGPSRALIQAACRLVTYGSAFDLQSAEVLVSQLRTGSKVRYLDGGWQNIIDHLRAVVLQGGGEICRGRPHEVVASGNALAGVSFEDGRVARADAVIIATGGPRTASRLCASTPAAALMARAADAAVPARVATLDLILDGRPDGYCPYVVGVDQPVFLTTASDAADLGSSDRTVLHITRYLATHERSGAEYRRQMEDVVDLAAPGWRARIVEQRFLPSMVVSHDLVAASAASAVLKRGLCVSSFA